METTSKNTTNCRHCGEPFNALRKDAKFCSETCRWAHWKSKQEKKTSTSDQTKNPNNEIKKSLMDSLQGIIPDEPAYKEIETKTVNKVWRDTVQQKNKLIGERDQLKNELTKFKEQETNIKNETGDWMIVTGLIGGAIGGGLIGNSFDKQPSEDLPDKPAKGKSKHKYEEKIKGFEKTKKQETKHSGKFFCALIGTALGGLIGNGISKATQQEREAKKQKALTEVQGKIAEYTRTLERYALAIADITTKANAMPRWITSKQQVLIPSPLDQNQITVDPDKPGLSNFDDKTPAHKSKLTLEKTDQTKIEKNTSEKIISSTDLQKRDYKALHFQDKWAHLFGYPSINFHCVIHGMSGEGKSTLAIQFANYLAEHFGKVIYISGEEGFSKTFKDKFVNNNASSANLFVADLRKPDAVLSEVPNDEYNFIFIDSLDNMRIDAEGMKKLREHYKDSALITISQSTKDGKMRGSYEIVHDSDIAVKVENGIAKTTKNRFKEKNMEMRVFGKKNPDSSQLKGNFGNELF